MTGSRSTIPAVKAWLFGQLVAAFAAEPALLVAYGEPGPNQPDDLIVVGEVQRQITPFALVGSQDTGAMQETYSVFVVISVFRGGDQAQQVFERACALADDVIGVQRADPTMGGLVFTSWPKPQVYPDATWTDDHKGRVAEFTVEIECQAVI